MNILGISCFYHDSAACVLKDGEIVAAAQEERFNRIKNSPDFPINAINFCIQAARIGIYDIDYIGFYEKPYLKFSRVVSNHVRAFPRSFKNFLDTMPYWLQDRLILPLVFKRELGFTGKTIFIKHHLSHAASAFLVSPFEESAILTFDGVGEWATASLGFGKGSGITILKEAYFPDSLGLLYTAITAYLGFEALQGEGKVMGLAGYGKPIFLERLRKIVRINSDGSFRLDQRFFGFFNEGSKMYTGRFIKLFGKERKPQEKIEERHCDIAASLQYLVEEAVIKAANNLYLETKMDRLCLAGGLFLNCVLNHKILEKTPFKEVFIQPAAGDSGGALGVAAYIYNVILKNKRDYVMADAGLGPEFPDERIKAVLVNHNLGFKELEPLHLSRYIAQKIAENKIVGWFQGKMEFGPRALGCRSILANPCNPGMKELLNSKVKKRESFRPYAPAVLEEKAGEYFKLRNFSPFMLLAAAVKEEKRHVIPAVIHADGTARVQTVNKTINPRLWGLIKEFELIKGVPVVLNTSFNLNGEPVVCSPEDAISCFNRSQMDCLVLSNCVIERC
ncbi:MAG: carbamoyltransferase [Candidatus Omnitrophica bacterium]|nr:carbamoyltransferase [Candidatus Omnitrophota bacterium]MDD5553345.1 carbamoyltransferase [Candidatus Omnitrophota bacterium]